MANRTTRFTRLARFIGVGLMASSLSQAPVHAQQDRHPACSSERQRELGAIIEERLALYAEAFPRTAVFSCPRSTNVVVVGLVLDTLDDDLQLKARAAELDSRFDANFSFQRILENRVQ